MSKCVSRVQGEGTTVLKLMKGVYLGGMKSSKPKLDRKSVPKWQRKVSLGEKQGKKKSLFRWMLVRRLRNIHGGTSQGL